MTSIITGEALSLARKIQIEHYEKNTKFWVDHIARLKYTIVKIDSENRTEWKDRVTVGDDGTYKRECFTVNDKNKLIKGRTIKKHLNVQRVDSLFYGLLDHIKYLNEMNYHSPDVFMEVEISLKQGVVTIKADYDIDCLLTEFIYVAEKMEKVSSSVRDEYETISQMYQELQKVALNEEFDLDNQYLYEFFKRVI